MMKPVIAVVHEGTYSQTDGKMLWHSDDFGMFLPLHNDRFNRTNALVEKISRLSTGAVGASIADHLDMKEYGSMQKPHRSKSKKQLEWSRNFVFGPYTQAAGMILLKSAIDMAADNQDAEKPTVLDVDGWVDAALAVKDQDNDYTHFPDEELQDGTGWLESMTGEKDIEVLRSVLNTVCCAVVELPDFANPQQLAYRGSLATMYRYA